MVGRGVLLDVPRALGVDWLEPGYAIGAADLELAIRHPDPHFTIYAESRSARELRLGEVVVALTEDGELDFVIADFGASFSTGENDGPTITRWNFSSGILNSLDR